MTHLKKLAGLALFTISAAAQVPHEATGEDILALCREHGAKATVAYGNDGKIDSIRACVRLAAVNAPDPGVAFEYDDREMPEVLESLEATAVTPSQIVGDLAQTSVTTTVLVTGATDTTTTVTLTEANSSLAPGQPISGAGIPSGTTIEAIDGTDLTLSQAATATASGVTLTVTIETQVLGLSDWTIDWKRKTVDATTTDNDTYESSLPSTASWTVKAKYIFIDGDVSQANNVLNTINTPQTAATWNFFPTIAVGRIAFQGAAYVDGITFGSGMGKVVGLDCSLKGTGPLMQLVQAAPVSNPNTVTGQQAMV